ncbi:MAG TPA: redox-regulated ATPase YchF, partial [Alphaproteobacteria bacterium]|nr:redox-regulated ATPase YchF [Alphaproteobacteria bacterium]
EDGDITHVEGRIDPLADAETVETELMLADLESLERRLANTEKKAKTGDKEAKAQLEVMTIALALLREGKPARSALKSLSDEQVLAYRQLMLLTAKPVVYVANVEEASAAKGNAQSDRVAKRAAEEGAAFVAISAKIESEIAMLSADERAAFLEELGLQEPGLNRLIRAGYDLLGLITYFTVGPKETRAWT